MKQVNQINIIKFIAFLFCFVTTVHSIIVRKEHPGNYLNDENDAHIFDFPYMLSLRRFGNHICGASVISENWALTAGHCLAKITPNQVTLRGGHNNRLLGTIFTVSNIVIHPDYDGLSFDSDVAVVRATNPFYGTNINTNISPILLGVQGTIIGAGSIGNVAGWGITSVTGSQFSETLQAAEVQFHDVFECTSALSDFGSISINMICAGGKNDTCHGDDGGPIVHLDRLVGIVSWSPACDDPAWSSVYTRIASNSIRLFIRQHTQV